MKLKIWFPLLFTMIIYWLLTIALLSASLIQTHGHFGYPLDDTYIHMAIAKHFVNEGFWGVSQTGFSSSTSSPLWTLLVAAVYRLFGVNDWAPLALSFIFGNLIIILCYFLLKQKTTPLKLSIFLLFIVLFFPLPVMTLTGMEHTLQGFLTIWLIYLAATLLTKKAFNSRQLALIMLLSSLVTFTRYEGLFLVAVISLLLLISKKIYMAFLVGIAGLLPIIGYGLISISQGWYFFPNSILLKGNIPVFSWEGIVGFFSHMPNNLIDAPHILVLIIACLMIYLWGKEKKILIQKESYLIVIFLMTTLLHMQFANVGWFFRYEAYLVLAGCVILADVVNSLIPLQLVKIEKTRMNSFVATIILSIFVLLPLATRAGNAFRNYPIAVKNIFEQQYQMGIFLKTYYEGKTVAANDIGAISFLSDTKVLDLFGLGSMDVAQAKRKGLLDKNMMTELARSHNVGLVIIYNSWFEGLIPSDWVEVGRWQISNNVVCASDTVSFYAPTFSLAEETTSNLKKFSVLLPSTVNQSGKYMNP